MLSKQQISAVSNVAVNAQEDELERYEEEIMDLMSLDPSDEE